MPGHLNLYEPYERKEAHHEDALTRAFLLVLRGVPVAHAAWLHLVDKAHRANAGTGVPPLHELPAPAIHMQTARVPEGAKRVVSVVQTDTTVFREADAKSSDRRQVLDAAIGYGKLAIVVENKPFHGHIWEGQLDVNVPEGVEHDKRVATVTWASIVTAWGRLVEAGHLSPAENLLLGDFLDYVEAHFPQLRPYSRVSLCGDDHERLRRRCKALLEAIAGPEHVEYHRGWSWNINLNDGQCARKIGLYPLDYRDQAKLVIEFVPGDTMSQARAMLGRVALADIEELLGAERWSGQPNFHLIFMTTGFFSPAPRHSLTDYWRIWTENRKVIRQWKRAEYDDAFAKLLSLGIVGEEDRESFHRSTTNTNRNVVNFAPAARLWWKLPLDEAAFLDRRDELTREIRLAIETGARALKLELPWAAQPGATE